MPGFGIDPVSIGLGLVSAVPSIISGFQQRKAARDLKLADTSTPEEREQLAMSRQAAATSRLPGMGAAENRLGQIQAGAVQNARMGAASSSDFLASAGAADARRMQGEQALQTQGLQYQDGSKRQLRADLTTASNRRQRDLDTYNNTKAALTQGSATNLNNGVQTLAAYGAQAYNMGGGRGSMGPDAGANGDYSYPGMGRIGMYPRNLNMGRYMAR